MLQRLWTVLNMTKKNTWQLYCVTIVLKPRVTKYVSVSFCSNQSSCHNYNIPSSVKLVTTALLTDFQLTTYLYIFFHIKTVCQHYLLKLLPQPTHRICSKMKTTVTVQQKNPPLLSLYHMLLLSNHYIIRIRLNISSSNITGRMCHKSDYRTTNKYYIQSLRLNIKQAIKFLRMK
jgi:hypothetical protein